MILSRTGNNTLVLGNLITAAGFGTGAGIAMLYVICAVCMFLIGLIGFRVSSLRNLEKTISDYDEVTV
ncbi:hypothetical protein [Chlorogloeopsis sp. ULAP02]|uniref:hypothetical protein n=1 Tax=Chlorogloeopsis sp. ULAP02 TaxID=3107926 RepID=UPI0031360A38